ncbi:MAG: TVP38/TMEM64 family protein [Lachnospiraceae bacterium]|nr:TVP38/TMEM64 family protein [Lachnospiraceae bacterium]
MTDNKDIPDETNRINEKPENEGEKTPKKLIGKRVVVILVILLLLAVSALLTVFFGKRILGFVTNAELVRGFVDRYWLRSRLVFIAITVFQIMLAFIPGEPVELAAGYAFGVFEGTVLCLIGAAIGSTIDFLIVKTFGMKALRVFFPQEKIDRLKFLKASRKRDFWMFMLMFIPGTPKDILSYVAGLTDISLLRWVVIATVARIPSILTSCVGASALGENKIVFAIVVFGVTLLISLGGMFIYNKICDKHQRKN